MRVVRIVFVGVALSLAGLSLAQETPKPEGVRPQVAKPLMEAQELLKAKNYAEALAKIQEAAAIRERTEFEDFTIERMRSAAAAGAGDHETAAAALEKVIASGRLAAPEKLPLLEGLAGAFYRAKNYPKAAAWASRYMKEGGSNPRMQSLLVQALYLGGDFAAATAELRAQVESAERTGSAVSEETLRLLASASAKSRDDAGYSWAVEKLVARYPKKEYWLDLIARMQTRQGFADRLALDVYRLLFATGSLSGAGDYVEMAQLAINAGLPAEAAKILEHGFASGTLGAGPDASRHKSLRDAAVRQAADDRRSIGQLEAHAHAEKDGLGLVKLGWAYVTFGDHAKGLELMERGLRKGVAGRPEDAKLRLGVAYLLAGRKDAALETLRTVQGTDGTADLARLWMLAARG